MKPTTLALEGGTTEKTIRIRQLRPTVPGTLSESEGVAQATPVLYHYLHETVE